MADLTWEDVRKNTRVVGGRIHASETGASWRGEIIGVSKTADGIDVQFTNAEVLAGIEWRPRRNRDGIQSFNPDTLPVATGDSYRIDVPYIGEFIIEPKGQDLRVSVVKSAETIKDRARKAPANEGDLE